MKSAKIERICPYCGQKYSSVPSISRKDSKLLICPDCGTREALAYLGVSKEEQEQIIAVIHKNCES